MFVVWAYPGAAALPIFAALAKYPQIHHVLVRHEQAAAHAADGYARATGRVGVCVATSGPGATNLVTGIATAMLDSVPMVAITAQVADPVIGTDTFMVGDVRLVLESLTAEVSELDHRDWLAQIETYRARHPLEVHCQGPLPPGAGLGRRRRRGSRTSWTNSSRCSAPSASRSRRAPARSA